MIQRIDRLDVVVGGAIALLILALVTRTRPAGSSRERPKLELGQLVAQVKTELAAAAHEVASSGDKPVYQVTGLDLEVQFVLKEASKNSASVTVEPVTLETSAEDIRERTHKVILRLTPLPPQDVTVTAMQVTDDTSTKVLAKTTSESPGTTPNSTTQK